MLRSFNSRYFFNQIKYLCHNKPITITTPTTTPITTTKRFSADYSVSRFFASPLKFSNQFNDEFAEKYDVLICSKTSSIVQSINNGNIPLKIFVVNAKDKKYLVDNTTKAISELILMTTENKIQRILPPQSRMVAVFARPNYTSVIRARQNFPIESNVTLLVNNIRKPNTLAAIIRTAALTNCRQILLYQCVNLYHNKVIDNCIPALFNIPIYILRSIDEGFSESYLPKDVQIHVPYVSTIEQLSDNQKLPTTNSSYYKSVDWIKGKHCVVISSPSFKLDYIMNETKVHQTTPLKSIANLLELPLCSDVFTPTPAFIVNAILGESYQQQYQNFLKEQH